MEQSPKPKLRPKLRLSYDDLKKIERVVEAEAKGEGVEGRNAIRGVIFNRLMSKRFPNTVDKVLSPREFEPVGTYGSVDKIPVSEEVLNERLTEMADYIQLGEDASKGSTFFLNKKLAKKRKTDFGGKDGMTIGNHTFYKSYEGQEPVEDINFSHNIEVYYKGYAEGGVAMDEQMDAVFKSSRTDIDPVSGNEVPPGSLPEEVRDDIPAMLSEGEYVVPADVLRFYGVKFFEDLRAQAKMGLAEMEANGRIGGEPIEEETGDVGISDEDLMVIMAQAPQEEQAVGAANGGLMGFQAGGLNVPAYIQQPDLTQFGMAGPDFQGGLEYRTYVNASGMEITIPFFDGEPMGMIPPGYSLKGEVAQQEEAPQVSQDDDDPVRAKAPAPEEFDLDAIPTEKLEETARGMSTMTNIASGIASMAGLPVAALVNTTGVARYNDVLDRLQAEDPEAFEKSGLEKKGSIFGGESGLYENLADSDGDGKKSFGDTWLGDFLGFDGEAGIAEGNPGLRDSIGGARRTANDDDDSPAVSTPTPSPEPKEETNNEPSGSSVQAAAESYSDLAEAEDKDYGLI